MIIHENNVMLHVPKCAGTYVRKCFRKNGIIHKSKLQGTHANLYDIKFNPHEHNVHLLVRNPLDWYVSFYTYSKEHKTHHHSHFSDQTDKEFKSVLRNMLFKSDNNKWHNQNIKIYREKRQIYREMYELNVSFYGYLLLKMTSLNPNKLQNNVSKDWVNFYSFEKMKESLKIILNKFGVRYPSISNNKVNASEHLPYMDMYDDEMLEWVYDKDSWIFDIVATINK